MPPCFTVAESGVLTSPTLTVGLPLFPFSSIGFYFVQFEVVLLGTQLFRTVTSSRRAHPFIIL